jgi:hypothetical protein
MAKKLQASAAALEELQRSNEANTKLIQVRMQPRFLSRMMMAIFN